MVALINPHKGKFNVTAKGGLVEEEYVDWVISRPYIFTVLLNIVGVIVGIWRYFYGPENEILTVFVSMAWVFYNLIILGGAVAVSVESKQVRRAHRVEISMPAAIARDDGHLFSCTVHDFSDGGLGIKINGQAKVLEGQKVNLLLKRGQQEYVFPTQVVRVRGNEVGLQLMPLTKNNTLILCSVRLPARIRGLSGRTASLRISLWKACWIFLSWGSVAIVTLQNLPRRR